MLSFSKYQFEYVVLSLSQSEIVSICGLSFSLSRSEFAVLSLSQSLEFRVKVQA